MHIVGPEIWPKKKKKNPTVKRVKWECTLQDTKYGGKHRKTWKMRNSHYRTLIMARNTAKP